MATESALTQITVSDAMHTGVLGTDPDTPLPIVARLMADRSVHVVAVIDPGQARRPLNFVTALDVVAGVVAPGELTALQAGQTEVMTVACDASVQDAAYKMVVNQVEHLLVLDPQSGHAEGIISALDIAAVMGREPQ